MRQAVTFAERVADRVQRVTRFFLGSEVGKLSQRLVPFLHSRREYVITKERWHTSHAYSFTGDGPEWIPVGEHVTLYFWRGATFRFWRGKCTSADDGREEGLGDRYKWDHEKYMEASVFRQIRGLSKLSQGSRTQLLAMRCEYVAWTGRTITPPHNKFTIWLCRRIARLHPGERKRLMTYLQHVMNSHLSNPSNPSGKRSPNETQAKRP